jgi:hypothetical protein
MEACKQTFLRVNLIEVKRCHLRLVKTLVNVGHLAVCRLKKTNTASSIGLVNWIKNYAALDLTAHLESALTMGGVVGEGGGGLIGANKDSQQ